MNSRILFPLVGTALIASSVQAAPPVDSVRSRVKRIDSGAMQIGIDLNKGGSITHLAWPAYPKNMVNIHDPGRLIQQSYYAGKILDRTPDGQHSAWSPWCWNPIQGGGVGSWARIKSFRQEEQALICETIPKLWDMPNEEAAATMKQHTRFEPGMPNVARVDCELICTRLATDRWGPPVSRAQELPAFYFTRNFHITKSYQGNGTWKTHTHTPGPPWGKLKAPRRAAAFFTPEGQGVGVYSPAAQETWNFGPHGQPVTDDPMGGPCMHVAPLTRIALGPAATFAYRYWIVVGTEEEIAQRFDALAKRYADDKVVHTASPPSP